MLEKLNPCTDCKPCSNETIEWMIEKAIESALDNHGSGWCESGDTLVLAYMLLDGQTEITVTKRSYHGLIESTSPRPKELNDDELQEVRKLITQRDYELIHLSEVVDMDSDELKEKRLIENMIMKLAD